MKSYEPTGARFIGSIILPGLPNITCPSAGLGDFYPRTRYAYTELERRESRRTTGEPVSSYEDAT